MANMSYCRFSNTLQDLEDCAEYLNDDDLSEAEAEARDLLIALCRGYKDRIAAIDQIRAAIAWAKGGQP